ncbi:MAG: glycoside hydrolase family 48 protein [Polyangiaceae bacterium]
MRSGRRATSPLVCMAVATAWVACADPQVAGPGAVNPAGAPAPMTGTAGAAPKPIDPAAAPPRPFTAYEKTTGNEYSDRFIAMWNDIHNPKNGYFSPKGIPYHAVETLLCEAPDFGHETTSEAYSYWIWLEALYGRITKDWSYLSDAWANAEANIIPGSADQPTASSYTPTKPASYVPELPQLTQYPPALQMEVPVGQDPLATELQATYGNAEVYAMHWLIDVDNWYGFGRRSDGKTAPAFINTFQRGPEESVFETIAQPSWDEMKWGGAHGFLDLFVKDSGTPQWRYSVAPDADARAVQAVYWAKRWADESGGGAAVTGVVDKAAKLGDFLRYSLFDKYFKPLGCRSVDRAGASNRGAEHYLLSWYYAWGGSVPSGGSWAWRIGSSASHQGYQNPMAAYALSSVKEMRPRSPSAWGDWARSVGRQLEFYRWLQSKEGAIAGGATNSWGGSYGTPPAGTPTFYNMAFDPAPVFHDPPSNEWFGFQVWSLERVAEYYYVTADKRAETILSKWVGWALKNTSLTRDTYSIPSTLQWSGQPSLSWDDKTQGFDGKDAAFNAGLHVTVSGSGDDVGSAASYAKLLTFWSARSGDQAARTMAKEILDRMWKKYRDAKGVAQSEVRKDYKRFVDHVFVPAGWKGTMPDGDPIDGSSTFLSIRSRLKADPDWSRVDAYLRGGPPPSFVYHRFWAQSEIATANATYGWLFPNAAKP